jgi:glycosyltransferase involved in cell wall biosynthesis
VNPGHPPDVGEPIDPPDVDQPIDPPGDGPVDVSIVTAVYDVARYLPDFAAALDAQRGVDLRRVEVVAVDDGSSDDSLAVLRRWQARTPLRVRILRQPNAGQGAARNLGLDHARGTWVTFVDPDDMVHPAYLTRILRFVGTYPDVDLVATNRIFFDDATGTWSDTHPLRWMFARGDRLVDLTAEPRFFHGAVNAAFFRRSRLVEDAVRFDDRIRPTFEDGHFCTRYLLGRPAASIGFLESAVYLYRRRSDGTSSVQRASARPERYTDVPRYGFLDVLEVGARRYRRAPRWVQNFVLYELTWLFAGETGPGPGSAATGEVAAMFLDLLRRIRAQLDDEAVEDFDIRPTDPAWRQILLHGLDRQPWHAPRAVADQADHDQRLVRVVTRFVGPEPDVEYLGGEQPLTPVHTKLRTHVYFSHPLLLERIAWLPAHPQLRVRVAGGPPSEPLPQWPAPPLAEVVTAPRARQEPVGGPAARAVTSLRSAVRTRVRDMVRSLVREPRRVLGAARVRARRMVMPRIARTWPYRSRFADAWVLLDRTNEADDSAEHLFRHLREHRPDVNAWFVLERGCADWARLHTEFGDRLVDYGSLRWQLLMFRCVHLVSSHIDVPVHRPRKIVWALRPREPSWRFTFLQHGVIKDDLSAWLNTKPLDLFVTSTPGEYASIAGDRTPYTFTSKEVRLTGLPRFDRLRRIAATLDDADRDLVLVAPTWRQDLIGPAAPVTGHRRVRDGFGDTEYARSWLGVLCSDELRDLAAEHGLRIGFLPHPLLQPILPTLGLPAHVEPLTFDGAGAQRLFAGAAVLVTDYSSMAFNAAYVDRPVVYFQFDADTAFAGGHVGRRGYFDYARDGFGPVTSSAEQTVEAVADIVERGCTPAAEYAERIAQAFVLRDGHCCERVVEEIEQLTRPAGTPRNTQRTAERTPRRTPRPRPHEHRNEP